MIMLYGQVHSIWDQADFGQKLEIKKVYMYEPRSEKTGPGFPTRSDTNQPVQPQEMARGLKFRIKVT